MQTPIVVDGLIYSCTDSGILNCYDAKSGEKKYQQRLGTGRTGFSASPVACGGKLYFTSEMGDIFVVQAGPAFQQVAENSMGEITMASPAISAGVLYFRTRENVVAVGAK
jgi:outer membrane protein assembly factor BamB